jgi:metallo-beta-lactamase family protein
MAITLRFLGGVRNVTGSSHLVSTGKSEVLLDAGLFQGHREEFYRQNSTFNYNPHSINALVVSHAHMDHCGNLPNLVKKGLRCKVYATSATRDLARLMLEDSGRIQEEDIKYVNKINRRLGFPLRRPLYTAAEALQAAKRFRAISYGQRFCVAKNIFATLLDAGHILGSSIIVLDIKEGLRNIRLGYAVDLGRKDLPLLNNPALPKNLDFLVIESTYGGRIHAPIEEAKTKLKDAINSTVAHKGKVLIPSFALERTQEVLYFLNELIENKLIPAIPIYVDSPLATGITELFRHNVNFLDNQTRELIARGKSPFESLSLKFIRDKQHSKALNSDRQPMIIIAGSGMCESGRILHHLINNIEDSRNTILVVGYMAQDTLGKKIVDKLPFVRIFGVEYELNAQVLVINSFSGHADKEELLSFVEGCLPLKRVFLVHADPDQSRAFSEALSLKGINAHIPVKDEEALLD